MAADEATVSHVLPHVVWWKLVLIDPTKNIIKDNERTSMNEQNTLLYKKYISLILFSKEAHSLM